MMPIYRALSQRAPETSTKQKKKEQDSTSTLTKLKRFGSMLRTNTNDSKKDTEKRASNSSSSSIDNTSQVVVARPPVESTISNQSSSISMPELSEDEESLTAPTIASATQGENSMHASEVSVIDARPPLASNKSSPTKFVFAASEMCYLDSPEESSYRPIKTKYDFTPASVPVLMDSCPNVSLVRSYLQPVFEELDEELLETQ